MKPPVRFVALLSLLSLSFSPLAGCSKTTPKVKIVITMPFNAVEGTGMAWPSEYGMRLALEDAHYRAGKYSVDVIVNNSADADGFPQDEKELAYAKAAAADPAVVVYFGSMFSSTNKQTIPILNRAGLAQISVTASYPGLTKSGFFSGEPGIYYPTGKRTFFRPVTTDDLHSFAAAYWISDLGYRRVYIARENNQYSQAISQAFRQVADEAGLQVVDEVVLPTDTTSGNVMTEVPEFDDVVAKVIGTGADVAFFAGYQENAVLFVKAIRQHSRLLPIVSGALYAPTVVAELGDAAENILVTFGGVLPEDLNLAVQSFAQRYQERFGQDPGEMTYQAVMSYDAMRVVLAAIAATDRPDRAAVLDQLAKIKFDGLQTTWSFDDHGDLQQPLITGFYLQDKTWKSVGLLRVR